MSAIKKSLHNTENCTCTIWKCFSVSYEHNISCNISSVLQTTSSSWQQVKNYLVHLQEYTALQCSCGAVSLPGCEIPTHTNTRSAYASEAGAWFMSKASRLNHSYLAWRAPAVRNQRKCCSGRMSPRSQIVKYWRTMGMGGSWSVKRKRQLISHVFVFVSCLFLRRFFVFVLVSANEIDLYSFCAIFVFVNVNYTGQNREDFSRFVVCGRAPVSWMAQCCGISSTHVDPALAVLLCRCEKADVVAFKESRLPAFLCATPPSLQRTTRNSSGRTLSIVSSGGVRQSSSRSRCSASGQSPTSSLPTSSSSSSSSAGQHLQCGCSSRAVHFSTITLILVMAMWSVARVALTDRVSSLQCFDAVGWAAGRASGL